MCGEHSTAKGTVSGKDGSSPHVRGTRTFLVRRFSISRFIPACAGNTARGNPSPHRNAVHPRMCGEHEFLARLRKAPAGSSPHVRGTLLGVRCLAWHGRFIPACAGNTWREAPRVFPGSVHPRMCGEHAVHASACSGNWRFIPACAGNTSFVIREASSSYGSSPHVRGTHTST